MVDGLEQQVAKTEREVLILRAVIEHGPIGIVSLSEQTDLPEHKVRYSLRMLENDGLIEPTPEGAVPTEDIERAVREINEGLERLADRVRGFPDIVDV